MFNEGNGPQSPKAIEEASQDSAYADMLAEYKALSASKETNKETEPEVSLFNELIAKFEEEHSLEALHQIIDLTPSDASLHPVREPARIALKEIVAQLKIVRSMKDIPPEILATINEDYLRVSRAVGIINSNKVDHTR